MNILSRADSILRRNIIIYRITVILLPFALMFSAYFLAPQLIALGKALPPCIFHKFTGFYCPGCGMTRSIIFLLHGDILLSIRNSILPYFAIILLIMLYSEWLAHTFGRRLHTFIHNGKIMAILGAAVLIFLIIRNFFPILCPTAVGW